MRFLSCYIVLATVLKGGFGFHSDGGQLMSCPSPVEVELHYPMSEDPRCNIISASVKTHLMFELLDGFINEDQRVRAVRKFETCRKRLCDNPAMIDQFTQPSTFTEMTNLLVAQVSRNAFPGNLGQLKNLVAGRYQKSISYTPFPVYEEMYEESQKKAVFKIIEDVCGYQEESVMERIQPSDITAMFLFVLVDEYTGDDIEDQIVEELLNSSSSERVRELWEEIAEKIFSPMSKMMRSCIDPAIAFPDHERNSVARVRELAMDLGVECAKEEEIIIGIPPSFGIAPPPSGPSSGFGGAPGDSSSSLGGAPGAPDSFPSGPPV